MSATIVDLFEEVLEVPFEDRFISNLDAPILRKLAFRVRDFYTQYELPPKNENELRPYLFPRFTTVTKIGSDYYSHPGHLKHGTYDFDPAAVGDVTSEVKKYLLYCHSLCIHDALPGLLDYFLEDNPYAQSRIPAVTHLLRQYAQLGSLLRYRVLIPVADEVTGFGDKEHVPVDEHEEAEVLVQFRNANLDLSDIEEEVRLANQVGVDLVRAMVRHIASTVKEQWRIKEQTNESVDLYFPSSIYIPVFKGLLLSLQKRFSSEGILEPFNVGVLGQLSNIDPTKVNVEDIVQLRQKGEFNDFRSFLCEVFDRLHGKRGYYSDLETEFASAVRSELREHSEQIKKMTDSSTVLREAFANSDRIIIAVGTGILPGAIANSPTMAILGGAAGAAGRILYDIVRAAILRSPNASRASFRNHFLALKTERS